MLGAGVDARGGAGGIGSIFYRPQCCASANILHDWQHRSAALLYRLGFSRLGRVVGLKSHARKALVDGRQMVLTPEQWHAVNPIKIATPRMRLRPLRPADATDLARIAGNDRVAPMLASVASPWPEADVLRWIEQRRWRDPLSAQRIFWRSPIGAGA